MEPHGTPCPHAHLLLVERHHSFLHQGIAQIAHVHLPLPPSLPACLRAFLCACMAKLQFRFATKYRHTDGKLVLKATDDHVVSVVHGTAAHCFVFILSKHLWTTCEGAVRQGGIVG